MKTIKIITEVITYWGTILTLGAMCLFLAIFLANGSELYLQITAIFAGIAIPFATGKGIYDIVDKRGWFVIVDFLTAGLSALFLIIGLAFSS